MQALPAAIEGLDYDICVITGDFRGKTFGPHRRATKLIGHVLRDIGKPVYGVLGNHGPASMLLGLEATGVRMLMNEAASLARDQDRLRIVGIDDPHFFKTNDLPLLQDKRSASGHGGGAGRRNGRPAVA
jgi:uncharacterized protein